jgi:hypothetical protein
LERDIEAISSLGCWQAGPELDAEISDCFGIGGVAFSQDIAAAWQLIDFWHARKWRLFKMAYGQVASMPGEEWSVMLRVDRERLPKVFWADGYARTPALAICRASLQALVAHIGILGDQV